MGVRFIIGRAGSGKTRRCAEAIVAALRDQPLGPPIYWILPKQATFQAERDLACGSGLEGHCRAHVVSFEQLAKDLLEECGGAAIPEIDALGRQMLLGMLLRKNEQSLKFFNKVARHPGLAARLDATLGEFDRAGHDAQRLAGVLKQIAEEAAGEAAEVNPLHDKLHDLQLLYSQYTAYLGQDRVDPRQRLAQVLACIDRSRLIRGAQVYVDGFTEFSESERRILARLGKTAASVEIALLMEPDAAAHEQAPEELSLCHRVESTRGRLLANFRDEGVPMEPPVLMRSTHRFKAPALHHVESSLFGNHADPQDDRPNTIQLVQAPNRRAEVDHAARTIRRMLARGVRLREIGVMVRQLDLYHDLINASFREHDIPYFVDRRRTMAHHPLLQLIRSILSVLRHRWRHDAVMTLIKTGLAGLSAAETDRLENYVLEHKLRGSVWTRTEPWRWHRRLTRGNDGEEDASRNDSAEMDLLRRRLADALRPFARALSAKDSTLTIRQIVVELFGVLEHFDVRETLGSWIETARQQQLHEQAGEHEQVWTETIALFDQMVELIGNEPATLTDFQEILEAALETFDLALTPPTVDQVLVGQVDRTRAPELKAVLVLGLNEGVFPYAPRDGSILSDAERFELEKHQFEVEPDARRRLLDERLLGYLAFTRASDYLYLSRSMSDDAGRALGESSFWTRLRTLYPNLKPRELPRDERLDPTLIGTPRQLLTTLMRWVRLGSGVTASANDPRPALYNWLVSYPSNEDPIGNLRYRAWKALSYDNSAWLTATTARTLFPRPLQATARQIEIFASCSFRHFLKYGLKLREREDDDLPELDLENAYHQVLENLVREMLAQKRDWSSLPAEQCSDLVHAYAEKIGQSLAGELMLSSARNRYLLERIERTLEQVVCNQQAVAKRGGFQTRHSKVDFGTTAERSLPPLVIPTPGGDEVHLSGRIDRVDVLEQESAFAVIDYRLFGGEIHLGRAAQGLSIGLLTQLLVLEAHAEQLAGKKLAPAAAFYVRLLRQLEAVDHPDDGMDPEDPRFPLRGKQRGIFDTTYFQYLDNAAESGASDVVSARMKKDGSLGYKSVTDIAEPHEFRALLEEVRKVLGRLGDQILSGVIDITPYRIHTTTPCSFCEFRSVCRFDPAINRYHTIQLLRRDEVLSQITASGGP